MIKLWKLLSVSIVLAVCLGLMLVPGAPPQVAVAAANSGVEVVPNVTAVGFSQDFDLEIWGRVPAGQAWDTGDVHLNFSPTYMQVNSITNGTLPTHLGAAYDNINGTIDYTAGVLGGNVAGDQLICTINCTSKSTAGISTIYFVNIEPLRVTDIINGGDPLINWDLVVNGTVKVGGPPAISSVSPDNLTFNATVGENPPAQTLEVCNTGNDTLDWSLSDNAGWLSETPTSDSLGADECEDVTVSVDVVGMEAGDYSATIAVTGSAGVAVSLHIGSAAPVVPANLSASSVSISPPQVKSGEEVTISFNVTNTGGETGSYNATLYINGAVEDSQSVSVAPGMTENVIFTVSKSDAGVYNVSVAGQSGQFEVVSAAPSGGGLSTGRMVAIVVVAIVLIVVLVFGVRRARRGI